MRAEGNPLLLSQARYLSRPKSARWVSLRSTHPTSLGALLRREARHGNAEVNQNLNAKDQSAKEIKYQLLNLVPLAILRPLR